MTSLKKTYDVLSEQGMLNFEIPDYIKNNLNPKFELREYQKEAIARFIHYISKNTNRVKPSHLLYHMATGSGKTLLMATNILYLYEQGYRNFLFFVNSKNIIEKTRENFLNKNSSKYLFDNKIRFKDKKVEIQEVNNFENFNENDINIVFTTIQGLHSYMNTPRENTITYEDFKDKKLVILSDEAHHINALTRTKSQKTKKDEENIQTWEGTVNRIFNKNTENIMLEYTATIDIEDSAIYEKYKNKIIFEYSLKQFRQDGFSKEVKVLDADLDNLDRMLQAMILSQYRRKVAEQNKLHIKPVILFKSKYIKDSEKNEEKFRDKIKNLKEKDIRKIESQANGTILEKAFKFFKEKNITYDNLVIELKEDFSEEKCILLDSNNIEEENQLKLNSLEDLNNEIRAIFAVNMLNEGWDVLNLYDIVRLYETRDGRWLKDGTYKPGSTTLSEVQLIGRGARYYPFKLKAEQNKFKRKYDQQPENQLKILEELYYHSPHKPKYIQELNKSLKASGIKPPQKPKKVKLKVKKNIKKTDFWKKGVLFINKKVKEDRTKVEKLDDLDISKNFGPINLRSGFTKEKTIFKEKLTLEQEKITKYYKLNNFNEKILQKGLMKLEFYKFNNLKKFFPKLDSMKTFVDSLKDIKVNIRSSRKKLKNLSPDDKLEICLEIFNQLKSKIESEYNEYKGTKLFIQKKIKDVVKDKDMNINVEKSGDQEYGVPMSKAKNENLTLNLLDKKWYVYNENYGTSEEKHFIQFINSIMEELEDNYEGVYLVRNANLFKIYKFSNGEAIEPDFVLFLKEKDKKNIIQYQLFVESKGSDRLKEDQWKKEFLTKIEDNYETKVIAENKNYKIIGMPFYNEKIKHKFINTFTKKLDIKI